VCCVTYVAYDVYGVNYYMCSEGLSWCCVVDDIMCGDICGVCLCVIKV
jgi:hypothetical protein